MHAVREPWRDSSGGASQGAVERQPDRRPALAIAAAVVGIVLLGAILTISLGKGTVVVEGPPDGDLPEDVQLVLTGGGKQLEISSAEKWKLSVRPGAYQVDI